MLPSKGQINRSGNVLRDFWRDPGGVHDVVAIDEAIRVVSDFRAAHAYPMLKVRIGLRSMVRTEQVNDAVSQRLKRVPRIVRKLDRMGNTSLARLEDVGGCRAVVTDGPELERLRRRVVKNWRPAFAREPRDYIDQPKPMGYRAVHYIVKRDGRAIEVQLRTQGQQQWAEAVEAMDARRGYQLKDEIGPSDLVEYFRLAGLIIYRREYGLTITPEEWAAFNDSRSGVIAAGYYSE